MKKLSEAFYLFSILIAIFKPHFGFCALERVGPIDPVNGFPTWYQDRSGLALEFCGPKNDLELSGGWCLLLPGDTTAPENFPTQFSDEHFYYAAQAIERGIPNPALPGATLLADLRLALEAAFLTPEVIPGNQLVFARVRIRIKPLPYDGNYTVYTPVGKYVFTNLQASAPQGLFFTDDFGINCPLGGSFECVLATQQGPFLLPSATPGGAEMPALTAIRPAPDTDPAHFGGVFAPTDYPGTGKAYIADPARIGPVTGSALAPYETSEGLKNPNLFRIEGPNGFVFETVNFNLIGRIYEGTIPGRVQVTRSSYSRNATGVKLDTFADAFETTQSRLPGELGAVPVLPNLSFFDARCSGVLDPVSGDLMPPYSAPLTGTEWPMLNSAEHFYGQAVLNFLPENVCVEDLNARDSLGNVVPTFHPKRVVDEVTITRAVFDPLAQTLTVTAQSSDTLQPPTLTLAGYGAPLVEGQIVLSSIAAPPSRVRVLSSAQGVGEAEVVTLIGGGATTAPVATPDTYSIFEDAPEQSFPVLLNDLNVGGATVMITANPRLGTVNVSPEGVLLYTPHANANGSDSMSYRVIVGTQVSNVASVAVTIAPVNDLPVAVDDVAAAVAQTPVQINLLANDQDVDGPLDLVAAVDLSPSTPAGAALSASGGVVTVTAPASGTYTFTYFAQDAQGAASALPARVTVSVAAQETLTITRSEYRAQGGRLRVDGTVTPASGQSISVYFLDAQGRRLELAGTANVGPAGAWAIDRLRVVLPSGAVRVEAVSSLGAVRSAPLTLKP